jgi:hypothetical protein
MMNSNTLRSLVLGASLPLLGGLFAGCQQLGLQTATPAQTAAKAPDAASWKARQDMVRAVAQQCMQGIDAVTPAGRADYIRIEGEGAFPIAGNQLSRRGWRFPVAGAESGQRRAIVLGIEALEPNNEAMSKLADQSLAWLGTGLPAPAIGLVGGDPKTLPAALQRFKIKPVKANQLATCDILLVQVNTLDQGQLAAVEAWSQRPQARLLCLGRADAWVQQALGADADVRRDRRRAMELADAFPGNRVIRPFGLAFGGSGLTGAWKCPGTADWSLLQAPAWAIALVTANDTVRGTLSAEELQQLGLGISQLQSSFRNSPEKARQLVAQIMATVNSSPDGKINTVKSPWLNLCASLFCELAQQLPPEALPVPACVKTFPGLVDTPDRLGKTRVEIDLAVPRWHSTGVYAVPGEVVTISLPPELVADGIAGIQVGCHTDNVRPRTPDLDRFPTITRYFRITGPTMNVACAFGGPIYIDLRQPLSKGGKATVTLKGGAAMPIYRTGDSLDTWKNVRNAPAPWAEFQGKHLIITVPANVARTLDNPDEILAFWDQVVEVQDGFIGYTKRTSPERFVYDRQISVGWMHSGYPLMAFDKVAQEMFDMKLLHKKGNWGCFHELGHNHQSLFGSYENAWTFDDNVEVTVNLFSAYTYVKVLGGETTEKESHNYWNSANLDKNLAKEYKPGTVYGKGSHLYRSLFFAHLAAEFGWDSLGKCLSSYWDLNASEQPKDDLAKRSLFLVRMSKTTGYNLAEFFTNWGLETTEAARQQVASLPTYTSYKHTLPMKKEIAANAK